MKIFFVAITVARPGKTRTIINVTTHETENMRLVDLIGKTYKGASVTAEHRNIEAPGSLQYSIGANMF